MNRKRIEWKFRGHTLELGPDTLIVAVLNVTPDSFSDGGKYADPDAALHRALELEEQGADIIDIGAESTKPGSERVSEAEELRRLIPVLKKLKDKVGIPISVDTYKPAVAANALEQGAHIINDVSGLTWEPELAKVVLKYDAGLILNHLRGTPQTWAKLAPMRDVMGEIVSDLEASLHRAVKAGVAKDHVILDPGIGFGKRREQNAAIIARLRELERLRLPILVGPSRKSFLAQDTEEGTEFATTAAVTASILNGARLVRVHEVLAAKSAVAIADSILAAEPEEMEAPESRVARRDREGKMREVVFGEEPPKRPVQPPALKKAAPPSPAERKDLPLFRDRTEKGGKEAGEPVREDRPPFRREPGEYQDRPGSRPAWGRGRTQDREDRPSRPPRRDAPPPRGDRPSRGDRPASRGDRPPLRGDRPASRGDRPPSRGDRPAPRGDRPPPRGDRPPPRGDRPPPRGDRSAPRGDRPAPRGDRPAPRGDRPAPRGDRPAPRGERPPSRGDRPPRREAPPRGGDRTPRGGMARPPREGDRTPRREGPPKGGTRSSFGDRPPRREGPAGGDRPNRPRSGGPGGNKGPRRGPWTPPPRKKK